MYNKIITCFCIILLTILLNTNFSSFERPKINYIKTKQEIKVIDTGSVTLINLNNNQKAMFFLTIPLIIFISFGIIGLKRIKQKVKKTNKKYI